MSDTIYYFSEFSEDDVLHSLAKKAKDMLQDKNFVFKIYSGYKPELYGLSLNQIAYLMELNNISFVSYSQQSFLVSRKRGSVSKRPETTNQVPSTPVKTNISSLQRKHLPFDNVGNEASQSVIESPEKQSTPVKIFRSATEPESLRQEHAQLIIADKEVSETLYTNQMKKLTSVKVSPNATKPENFLHKSLPPGHKEINNAEPVNLESLTPVGRQTVIISPNNTDREILNSITEIGRKYANPITQNPETAGKPEADERKLEKSDEAVMMSSIFTAKVQENLSPYKEVRVDGVPTTDGLKNTRPKKKATASDNRKSFGPAEETTQIIKTSKGEKKDLSPVKKANINTNPATKSQKSVCSDNKAKMLVHSYQEGAKNITPNQGSNLFKNCERKRKSTSPRTDTVQCSSMSTIIHSSGAVEIETGISRVSTHNPSPKTSPILLINYKSANTITDNIDKEKSPKDINVYGNESKPGCSRYVSPSAKGNITSNPATKSQKSVCSDNKAKMLVHSYQEGTKNITPNQGSNLFKNCERKRKSTSPRTDTVQCSSMSTIIHSSGAVEIETDISRVSTHNPSPKTSPILLMDDKSANTITYNIDKEKSPKDINVYGNESKPGCSRYISPSAKGSITSSPTFEANTNSPIRDVIDLGRDRLSYKPSKRSPPTNLSSATLSSPRIQNFDSNTLVYCITQLKALLSIREECLVYISNCLLNFKHNLEYLCHYLQVIVHIAHKISMIKADYVSEKLQMNILSLITIASELVKQLGSWKMDVAIDIQHWVINFQEIRKIISQNEPLVSNDKPLVTMEFLHAYEEDMKTIWKKLDVMMMVADCKRRLFLTTEPNFQKFINLFLECLVTVGILKPYSPPTL